MIECAGQGWQSEERFAESFVRSRMARGFGVNRIRQELRLRGVEAELPGVGDPAWQAEMERVYARKYRGKPIAATPQERASRSKFLMQRGFTPSQIQDFLKRLGSADDFSDSD
ncbi:MAG: regulatory protein RecX [Methylococcus sp.]|nr:regulatory protein RecX [Methylococcus sp.]